MLEVRGTQLANLDNCEHSLKIINSIVNRSGVVAQQLDLGPPEESDGDGAVISGGAKSPKRATVSSSSSSSLASTPAAGNSKSPSPALGISPMNTSTPQLNRTLTFDHGRCTDCSYGYMKTCDCTNHLNALQKQSVDANDRLQQLVEMRERVFEEAEKLIAAQGLDPSMLGAAGAKSGSGSSFSEMFSSPSPNGKKADSPSPSFSLSGGSGAGTPTPGGGKAVGSAIASEGIAAVGVGVGGKADQQDQQQQQGGGTWKDCDGTETDSPGGKENGISAAALT